MSKAPLTLDDVTSLLIRVDPTDDKELERIHGILGELASAAPGAVGKLLQAARAALEKARGGGGKAAESIALAARLVSIGTNVKAPTVAPAPSPTESQMAPEPSVPNVHAGLGREQAPAAPAGNKLLVERVPAEVDADLIAEFAAESRDHLRRAESCLLSLESNPTDGEAIAIVFRAFHTVKGCASIFELKHMTNLAHQAESVLTRIRDKKISYGALHANLSLRCVDVMKEMLDALEASISTRRFLVPETFEPLLADLAACVAAARPSSAPKKDATHTAMPAAVVLSQKQPETKGESDAIAAPANKPAPMDAPLREAREDHPLATSFPKGHEAPEASVRIRTQRLDRLIDIVGELVIAESMVEQDGELASAASQDLMKKVGRLGKIVRELQDLAMSLRMVPLRPTFQKLVRVMRDTTSRTGRQAELVSAGEDTEIDRNMVDVVADPLIHMVRNAVDHGIESPDERTIAGKPKKGTIRLSASHAGGNVVLELADDGKGLDRAKIVAKALERGLITSDANMTDSEVFELIFEAGFSTAAQVTDVSGRGVGMDVVRRSIQSLNGRVEIMSELGKGTTFTIRLPLTLAITDGMLVQVGGERFIIPTCNIRISLRPGPEMLSRLAGKGEILLLRGQALPLFRLDDLFGLRAPRRAVGDGVVVVINSADGAYALAVDELLGQQQVVAKPLEGQVAHVAGVLGGAILGDGRVGLILDTSALGELGRQGLEAPFSNAAE